MCGSSVDRRVSLRPRRHGHGNVASIRRSHLDQGSKPLERPGADPSHADQIVDSGERSRLHDPSGHRGTDARKQLELGFARAIDVETLTVTQRARVGPIDDRARLGKRDWRPLVPPGPRESDEAHREHEERERDERRRGPLARHTRLFAATGRKFRGHSGRIVCRPRDLVVRSHQTCQTPRGVRATRPVRGRSSRRCRQPTWRTGAGSVGRSRRASRSDSSTTTRFRPLVFAT